MFKKLSREVKTGIVALITIVILLWGLNYLKGRNIFVGRTHFFAVYKNIDGLLPNNPVLINGMRVGQVKEIYFHPNNDGNVIIHMVLTNTDLSIPDNTVAQIYSDGLMGGKAVQLIIGDSKEYAQTGDTLSSELQAGLTDELSRQLKPIKDKAENLIVSLDSIVATTKSIFDDRSQNNLKNTLQHINNTAASVDNIMIDQKDRLMAITKNIESITSNIKNNNEKLNNIIRNFNNISDSIAKSNIASTINKVDRTMKETSEIMAKINSGKGSMGMLLNNDSLYVHLDAASNDLDKLLEDMRLHPKRYVHLSVFGSKEKEKKEKKKKK